MFEGSAAFEMPDYFKPMEEELRDDTLNFRVPGRLKKQLVLLAEIWDQQNRIKKKRRTPEMTYSDTAIRLLAVGLAGAWEELKIDVDENGDPIPEQSQKKLDELKTSAKPFAK